MEVFGNWLTKEGEDGAYDHPPLGVEKIFLKKEQQPHTLSIIASTNTFAVLIPLSKVLKVRTCY